MKTILTLTALLIATTAPSAFAGNNGSNASGANTTSYGGSGGSIWNSDPVKAQPTVKQEQKLIPPVRREEPKPVADTIRIKPLPVKITPAICDPCNCKCNVIETVKPVVKPAYPKAIKNSVRGRG